MLAEARTPPQFKLNKYLFGMSEFLRWMRGDDAPRPRINPITDNDGELERGLAEWMASHETIDGEEGARELGTAIHALLDFAVQHRYEVVPHEIPHGLLDDNLLLPHFREHYELLTRAKACGEAPGRLRADRSAELACEADALRTEHAFMLRAAPDAGVFLHGRCDLLIVSGGELSIVDYKTDRISSAAQRDSLVSRYAPQLALYALAAQALYGGERFRRGWRCWTRARWRGWTAYRSKWR